MLEVELIRRVPVFSPPKAVAMSLAQLLDLNRGFRASFGDGACNHLSIALVAFGLS